METQQILTVVTTNKAIVPSHLYPLLVEVHSNCQKSVKEMLHDRTKNSTKYYPLLKSAIANELIRKYQRNRKCNSVKNCVIPICGAKGVRVKLEGSSLSIPCLFKKELIPIKPLRPIIGFIRSVEFFKRGRDWFMSYTYNTPKDEITTKGVVGVDRNARGNVATVADPLTGKVIKLGPDIKPWKDNLRNRRGKLQRAKAFNLLKKINRKQSNRTKDINHKVSKAIVKYAASHCRDIVLEDLGKIKSSRKCGKYVKKSNWSFRQLETFITYKASLRGIAVHLIDPAYTSKMCSRCGQINNVAGKKFECSSCKHHDHRDANAAFNIAAKYLDAQREHERECSLRPIDGPLARIGVGLELNQLHLESQGGAL